MKKIESLTTDQEKAMVAYRNEWLKIGRSCEPADRATAERCLKAMYAAIGKKEPLIWWCDGPATGSIIRTVLRDFGGKGDNLRDNLWANLGANLGDNLRDNLRANLGANLWDNLSWYFWGQHESAWPAFYVWPHDALRPMHDEKSMETLSWWIDLSKSVGWWHPCEGVVFACERPLKQSVDDRGRLHCEDGPAIICRDGWKVYAIHNVRVPEYIVDRPHEITADKIKSEQNAEIRRIMMQRFGFDRYVQEIGANLVNSDMVGKLWRIEDEAPFHLAEVINSTPEPDGSVKTYFIPLPDENDLTGKRIKTCREGVAWTFSLHEHEYHPAVQT